MKKVSFFGIAIIAISAVACHNAHKEDKTFSSEPIPVKVVQVQHRQTKPQVVATGLITTDQEAKYGFKIGGIIENVYVEEGQYFKKGQLLATLKTTEIESQLQQAKLASEKARRDFNRAKNLYKDSVATLEQYQNAQTGLDVSKRTIDLVQFNKQYTAIYAQVDGFVTKKLANPGEVIAAGYPVLAINQVTAKQGWVLKVGVTDAEWAAIGLGDKANIKIDAYPNQAFDGTVSKKYLAADPSSGTFTVELTLNSPAKSFALGMYAQAVIALKGIQSNATIPYEALVEANGNDAFVFTPLANNKVKRVPIKIASFDQQCVTIQSGLENIPSIVIANTAFLNENTSITIQNK